MSNIKLFLLGPPRIQSGDATREVDTRKALALLAYLAGTKRRHGRDSLAALLWPEFGQSRSRAALRRTLSALKEARQEGWLEVDRSSVGLNYDDLWVDVDRFRELLGVWREHGHPEAGVCAECLSPLTEAVALYRDDFLAGFGLRDSVGFDDWQYFEAEDLRRELSGALQKLILLHDARGEFEPAIVYARRWLLLDTLHEKAHRSLMEIYARAGRRDIALRQYRECARLLQQELGVSPLEETTALYEDIKRGRVPAPPEIDYLQESSPASISNQAPPPDALPAGSPGYPLVGRSEELAILLGRYETVDQDGLLFVLDGEAGIGKTRLAEEFSARVRSRGAEVLTVRCWEGETNLAYGPFVEGLRSAVKDAEAARLAKIPAHMLAEAARLLPELAEMREVIPSLPPLDGPGAQSRFFEGLGQVLMALCSGPCPGVLFIDDLHWADTTSLEFVTYLVRRLRGRPLFILASWRGERLPAGHRLRALIAEAQREGRGELLELSRLSKADALELIRSTPAGVALSDEMCERVYLETEGQPFFLVEYLAAARSAKQDAVGDLRWPLPIGVRELLHSRLSGISETAWQILTAAAVIGRSFDFDTLREACGRDEEEAVTALEELISSSLVREVKDVAGSRDLTYDFRHEKLRILVYEETSLARRRLLHRRVGTALARRFRRSEEAGVLPSQIARHYQSAGLDDEAANYFKLAGDRARSLYANAEALAHFRSALALGYPDAATLHEAVGDLYTLRGEYGQAIASYETAAALCDPGVIWNLEHKLGGVHTRRGEWRSAESHYEAALNALEKEGQPDALPGIYADWSLTVHHMGEPDRALDLAYRALDLAKETADVRALAQVHNTLGILSGSRGDLDMAQEHLERSLGLAETLEDPEARMAALNNLARTYGAGGAFEQAIARNETALALCISQGDRHREAALRNNLADLLHAASRPEESMSQLEKAVTIFAEIGEAEPMRPEIWKLIEW